MKKLLNYTTLDLFVYDLADGIGQRQDEISQNRRDFWRKVYGDKLDQKLLEKLALAENNLSNYIELFGSGKARFYPFEYPLDGYYYAVKLGDTYALQIDCSGISNDPDFTALPTLEQLPILRDIILEKQYGVAETLGKTWLLWGQSADRSLDPESIARDGYRAIFSGDTLDPIEKGFYRGATIFAVERYDNTPDGRHRGQYCLMLLFDPDRSKEDIQKAIGEFYIDFIQLCHYRHKILWVYENSRRLKRSLKKTIPTIQGLIDSISDSLASSRVDLNRLQRNLADALSASHAYQTNLSYLEEALTNLEINTENYRKRLETIAGKDANADLQFLENFYEFTREKYIPQIQSDIRSLDTGSKPLNNTIATIQGIIEIEKTKNERSLNKTIAVVSAGIGTATLTATTFSKSQEIVNSWFPPAAKQPLPVANYWLGFALAFGLSLAIGVLCAWLTAGFLDRKRG